MIRIRMCFVGGAAVVLGAVVAVLAGALLLVWWLA